jgi:hypothetical protein
VDLKTGKNNYMKFKNKIKNLDEDQIKFYIKQLIYKGKTDKMLKSKIFKKSKYLQDIARESTDELGEFVQFVQKQFECPIDQVDFLKKSLKI